MKKDLKSYSHRSVVRRSPNSMDINPEAEESMALGAITKLQLAKKQQTRKI